MATPSTQSSVPPTASPLEWTKPTFIEERFLLIEGDPIGYCTNNGSVYNTARKRKYLEYKKLVQLLAKSAFLVLFEPSKERPIIVETRAYFRHGTHPDPENVHKGVKDALFYHFSGTKDKYTGGKYESPLYDRKNPRVEVRIYFNP